MTPSSKQVPPDFVELAGHLTRIADCARDYINEPAAPWPDSVCARDVAQQDAFKALPFEQVMGHVRSTPLNYLGSAVDHLTAMSAILRTPGTVLALSTVLRTQLLAAAYSHFLLEASEEVNVNERVRRSMNCYLESLAEQIVMMEGYDDNPGVKAQRLRLIRLRAEVGKAGDSFGWSLTEHRYIPGRPHKSFFEPVGPSDGQLLRLVMSAVDADPKLGSLTHRHLSAPAHAQQHGLANFVGPASEHLGNGDGTSTVTLRLSFQQAAMYSGIAVSTMTLAVIRGCAYYGWKPYRWAAAVRPISRMFPLPES